MELLNLEEAPKEKVTSNTDITFNEFQSELSQKDSKIRELEADI